MTYWSREVGPYVWHEYDDARTVGELRAIKSAGHHTVRTHLLWDAFMPTPARVEPARLRNLEHFLNVATELSLQVVPVLFVQALGGCLMLPSYAIDVGARRNDVRVVTDAVTQPGGSRYVYTDQMMLEVCVRWIDEILSAFAGHPAIVTWDLGHDPAGGVRPQRIEHLRSWLALISERIHEREQRCMLSLSADDLVIARAVRPAVVRTLVDTVGLDLSGAALAQVGGERDPAAAIFLAQLCESLSDSAPLIAHLQRIRQEAGTNTDDTEEDDDALTRRFVGGAFDGLVDCGCVGLMAAMWSNPGPRAAQVPPFDRRLYMRHAGVVDASGVETAFGSVWTEAARHERERSVPSPWLEHIDADDYYANLPESLLELRAAWERGSGDHPAMLR
ncbi:MAG: hypothetical protein WB808_01230 [Candidatus Dormiibacterota bacterium]